MKRDINGFEALTGRGPLKYIPAPDRRVPVPIEITINSTKKALKIIRRENARRFFPRIFYINLRDFIDRAILGYGDPIRWSSSPKDGEEICPLCGTTRKILVACPSCHSKPRVFVN